jgi:hypothetical protein
METPLRAEAAGPASPIASPFTVPVIGLSGFQSVMLMPRIRSRPASDQLSRRPVKRAELPKETP